MTFVAQLPPPPPGTEASWLGEAIAALPEELRCLLLPADRFIDAPPPPTGDLSRLVLGRVPVLAWFEGEVHGTALDLALAADLRICGQAAALRGPTQWPARLEVLAPGLARAIAADHAIAAADLLAAGLVNAVTPAGTAHAEADRLANVIASRGPIAIQLAKEAIWRGLPQPLEQALRFETDLTLLLQTTKDRAEGVRAFLEKRPPTFTGE